MLMVAVAASAYTQNANERLRQLEAYLQELGFEVRHSQSNDFPEGITHHWSSYFSEPRLGWKEDIRLFLHPNDKVNAPSRENVVAALDSIRTTFALLGKEATESYMYEYHRNDTDTIKYSLAFRQDNDTLRLSSDNLFNWFNKNAREIAIFEHNRKKYDGSSSYHHMISKPNGFSEEDMQPFNIEAFEAHIQPVMDSVMKLKGARKSSVHWQHDEGLKNESDDFLERLWSGESEEEEIHSAGLTTGTHYIIPLKYEAEAEALLQQLNSLTYDYVEQHPEQFYYYSYNSNTFRNDTNEVIVFSGPKAIVWSLNESLYKLSYSSGEGGFHILSTTTKGDYWLPKDWEKLKSYINGEKVYLKGMKPKTEKDK